MKGLVNNVGSNKAHMEDVQKGLVEEILEEAQVIGKAWQVQGGSSHVEVWITFRWVVLRM